MASLTSDARPFVQHHEMRFGDDFAHIWTFTDSAGVLVDVSAWGIVGRVDPELAGVDSVALTVTHVSTGVVEFSATAAELAGLAAGGKHWWEFVRGSTNETYFAGKFKVFADMASA
jgi:hypothetical protein